MLAVASAAQERIVSTSPAITETLFALGLGHRVVGVSTYCHYPPEARQRPKVGTYLRPNVEAIVRLRPDLVLGERFTPAALALLDASGIRHRQVKTGDLATNLRLMEDVARATGQDAAPLQQRVRAALDAIRARTQGRTPRPVIFIVGRTPGRLEGMVAVGQGSYLNELLALAGGRNIMAQSATAYPRVSLEAILRLKPDVIIDMGDMADTREAAPGHQREVERMWRAQIDWGGRVFAVASSIYVVPGPRLVDAAASFEKMLQGEAAH
jgi:iron complex transport system substrate-binding protein